MNTHTTHRRGSAATRAFTAISAATAFAALAAFAAFSSGCSKQGAGGAAAMAAMMGGGGPLEVGVYTLKTEPVLLTRTLPARTSAYRVAEVRARVSGVVLKRLFEEGATVKEGQQLYQIDDAPYIAALESAKATLARAQASLATAQAQADRFAQLVQSNAVSKQDFDNATAQAKASVADVAAASAALDNAQINLSYTKVYAPIAGRVGASQVTEGAYVQAATATLLATVQQLDPIYVDIQQPSNQALKLNADRAAGKLLAPPDGGFDKVTLYIGDQQNMALYPQPGKLQFVDVSVDPSASSVLLRTAFPNAPAPANGAYPLLPGMFVRAAIVEGVSPGAILVPQQGVSRNMKGQPTAWVVGKGKIKDKDGNEIEAPVTELRLLTTDRTIGDKWLVTGGLQAGDQVIVENLQRIRQAGQPVKPVPAGQSPGSLPITR